jgi:hypothetical protein
VDHIFKADEDCGGQNMDASRHFAMELRAFMHAQPFRVHSFLLWSKLANNPSKDLVKHVQVKGWSIFSRLSRTGGVKVWILQDSMPLNRHMCSKTASTLGTLLLWSKLELLQVAIL